MTNFNQNWNMLINVKKMLSAKFYGNNLRGFQIASCVRRNRRLGGLRAYNREFRSERA
jgi:hypothetical protein